MGLITFGSYARSHFACQLENDPGYRHATYVLGIQGSGKSTLLGHIAEQCVAAGEGVLVIDTKGELSEDIASRTTHPDKLIYVAPAAHLGSKRYWALNPLEHDRTIPGAKDRLVSNLRVLFDRMELANSASMPLVRRYLTMAALLAYPLPTLTLPDLIRVFYDAALRSQLYAAPDVNEEITREWQKFDRMTPTQQREVTRSTLNRLEEFMLFDVVKYMVTPAHSTIRLARWLDRGNLVVCNFGSINNIQLGSEVGKLLANFVLAQLVEAAYARPSVNRQKRRIWRVIVDEFQELAGEQFTEMIAQLRKYQVFPVFANQNLSQLSEKLRTTALSCRARFFLCTSGEDARLIRGVTHDDEAAKLVHYPDFQARAHLPGRAGSPPRRDVIKLKDWWADRDDDQLAMAIQRAEDDRFTLPEAWFAARRQSTVAAPLTGATNGTAIKPSGIDAWERPDQATQERVTISAGSAQTAGVPAPADSPGRGDPQPDRPAHLLDYGPGG